MKVLLYSVFKLNATGLYFGNYDCFNGSLQFIVRKTKIGRSMRAVSTDADAAKLMGINVDTTISITFAIGSALAGAAGVLVGVYYNSINPLMGMVRVLKHLLRQSLVELEFFGSNVWRILYWYCGNDGDSLWKLFI